MLRIREITPKGSKRPVWFAHYDGHEGCVGEGKSVWQAVNMLKRLFPAYQKAGETEQVTTVEQAERIEQTGGYARFRCGHLKSEQSIKFEKGTLCRVCHNDRNALYKLVRGMSKHKKSQVIEQFYIKAFREEEERRA